MPVILNIEYSDDTKEELRIPAEIWRFNNQKVAKLIITEKEIKSLVLDPHLETADTDLDNNYFPRRIRESRFQLFKSKTSPNPMQLQKKAEEDKNKEESNKEEADK